MKTSIIWQIVKLSVPSNKKFRILQPELDSRDFHSYSEAEAEAERMQNEMKRFDPTRTAFKIMHKTHAAAFVALLNKLLNIESTILVYDLYGIGEPPTDEMREQLRNALTNRELVKID